MSCTFDGNREAGVIMAIGKGTHSVQELARLLGLASKRTERIDEWKRQPFVTGDICVGKNGLWIR